MANVVILGIVAILMALAIRHMVKHKGTCAGCSGDCGCSHCSVAEKMAQTLERAAEEKSR